MQQFIQQYPGVIYVILGALVSLVLWLARQGLKNNTHALNRLTQSVDSLTKSLTTHATKIAEHDVRLDSHEKRLEKGGL